MDKTENGSPVSLEYAIVIGDTFHRTSPPTRDGFEFWTRFRIVNATETEIASSKRCTYIYVYVHPRSLEFHISPSDWPWLRKTVYWLSSNL